MNSILKRTLTIILVLVMCVSMLPASALAEDAESTDTVSEKEAAEQLPEEESETPVEGEATEEPTEEIATETVEEPMPTRVEFICEPAETMLSVWNKAALDENPDTAAIEPEDDGAYLLVPGTYIYDARFEGYVSKEKEEFSIDTGNEMQLRVVLQPITEGVEFNTFNEMAEEYEFNEIELGYASETVTYSMVYDRVMSYYNTVTADGNAYWNANLSSSNTKNALMRGIILEP